MPDCIGFVKRVEPELWSLSFIFDLRTDLWLGQRLALSAREKRRAKETG